MQRRNKLGILLVLLLFGTLLLAVSPVRAVDFYLTLDTSPSEVLAVDPEAVTGEGYYASGSWVTIDAKQTVESETVRYEFVEWSTTDNSAADPEDVEALYKKAALTWNDFLKYFLNF